MELIHRRMTHRGRAEDALDELFRAPPAYLARWMARKIALAGERSPWIPMAAPEAVIQAVVAIKDARGAWCIRPGVKSHDAWMVLATGLLQSLACLTTDEAGKQMGCHGATASRRINLHQELMVTDAAYAQRAGHAARDAIDRTFRR